jgi:hypothetical protein
MMLVHRKTEVREAWQYTSAAMPPWVSSCTERHDDGDLYLVRRSGKQRIEPSEWLIRNLDGDPEWMTDSSFRAEYE